MEFDFICTKVLNCDSQGFSILEGNRTFIDFHPFKSQVNSIIDKMGLASSKAQKLNNIITTSSKFFSSDHRLYFIACDNKVIGLIKVGFKKLFICNSNSKLVEISPLCVLDFYVHESQQRNGVGKALFEKMLCSEQIQPSLLGYDRPSEKFIKFLAKHYNLRSYVPQNNNFVVFDQYFDYRPISEQKTRSSTLNSDRKITSAGKNIIRNKVFNIKQSNQKTFINYFNSNVTNYVSENGSLKKVPFFDNNFVDINYSNKNFATSNLPPIINQSCLTNKNTTNNPNPELKSQKDNTNLKNVSYRQTYSSKQNIFNLEEDMENTINNLNKLELVNEKQGNNNFYKKRNNFATIFDEKREENKTDFIYEKGFKSKYEKSNIFF